MGKNSILNALKKADALLISSQILSDDVSLQHKDFLARHVSDMSHKGMLFFVVTNAAVLTVTLFRMIYLSVFDYAGFDVKIFGGLESKIHYLYLTVVITGVFLLFLIFPVFCLNRARTALYVNKQFQRRFIVYTYVVTMVWLVILSFYHHQVIYELSYIRSIEPALVVLIPLTYIGAMLVIPYFSIAMLLCLVVNQLLDSRWDGWLMNAVIIGFLMTFIGAVFYAVRRTIGFIAEVEFNNFKLTEKLIHSLNLDSLLSIPNRQAFFSRVSNKLLRKKSETSSAAILMLDVDHFKKYNDHYGHPAGDRCLQQVACCLQSCVREDVDMVGRYGGEEFIVFLEDADADGAAIVAQRICEQMQKLQLPHAQSTTAPHVTVSLGIALWQPGSTLEALCERADQALYQAKNSGRNGYKIVDCH
ncbi:GGDEF domain-containing protein [Aeromonas veronii]|uniref:GGDEF domain-containing protein n=1 Tax=Aeromonas TaxID=642 RepID=UPI0038E5A7D0